jgi:hypothetical protein
LSANDLCRAAYTLRRHALQHDPEKWRPVFRKIMLKQRT